jgi:hypothetical protein
MLRGSHKKTPEEDESMEAEIDPEIKSKRTCHLQEDLSSSLRIHRKRSIDRPPATPASTRTRRSNLEHRFPIDRTLRIPIEREDAVYRGTYLVGRVRRRVRNFGAERRDGSIGV